MDTNEKKDAHAIVRRLRVLAKKKSADFWEEAYLCHQLEFKGLCAHIAPTKQEMYRIIGMPRSTSRFKASIYEFYVVKHGIPVEQLNETNPKNLYQKLAQVRQKSTEQVLKTIGL